MTEDVKMFVEKLRGVIDEMPYTDNPPRLRSYSGRFMYGGRCVAVAVDNFAEIAMLLYYLGKRDEFGSSELYVDSAVTDDMGQGEVLYFTAAKLDDTDRLDDDDDELDDDE